jgi:hypothetical protein
MIGEPGLEQVVDTPARHSACRGYRMLGDARTENRSPCPSEFFSLLSERKSAPISRTLFATVKLATGTALC